MSFFEAMMMFCFGLAWPLNIYKSYKTRSAIGKSVFFLYVVNMGYVAGIIHKIFFNFDYVIILYIMNFVMVSIDTLLYYRNRYLDRERGIRSPKDLLYAEKS